MLQLQEEAECEANDIDIGRGSIDNVALREPTGV
jgi:hypothetical protein